MPRSRILTAVCCALPAIALAAASAAASAVAAGGRRSHPATPPAKRVAAAVKHAESSSGLWATVNSCGTKAHRRTIGVRAQMPSLGFAATQQMVVTLRYYSTAIDSFKPLPRSAAKLNLGVVRSGFHQDGVTFTVRAPATLDATVEFVWRDGSRVLARTTRTTTRGHKGVQDASPRGYSAAECVIR